MTKILIFGSMLPPQFPEPTVNGCAGPSSLKGGAVPGWIAFRLAILLCSRSLPLERSGPMTDELYSPSFDGQPSGYAKLAVTRLVFQRAISVDVLRSIWFILLLA